MSLARIRTTAPTPGNERPNMQQKLLVTNCRLFDAADDGDTVSILVENGVITKLGRFDPPPGCEDTIDAQGRIAAPGLIDVHIQGAGGADVLDAKVEALEAISKTCARFGTTGFLATTVFRPEGDNRHLSLAAECVGRDLGGAGLLGIHLEGPFISPDRRGMILPECVCPPSHAVLDEIYDLTAGHLRMMTIAPELPGGIELVRSLVDHNVIASFGHSAATYEQTLEGFAAGISHVTHTFNAMPSIHHRAPGPLVAILQNEQVSTQLISDGVHIHPAVVRLVFEVLGPGRTIPITDGMQAMGLPDGAYVYNGIEYESREGAARYSDGTLIGTALGLSDMLKRLMDFTGCELDTAIRTATENPAALLGLQKSKGAIEISKDADLILLDKDLSIHTTIVRGKIVFTA